MREWIDIVWVYMYYISPSIIFCPSKYTNEKYVALWYNLVDKYFRRLCGRITQYWHQVQLLILMQKGIGK